RLSAIMSSHENARVLLHKSQVYRAPRDFFSPRLSNFHAALVFQRRATLPPPLVGTHPVGVPPAVFVVRLGRFSQAPASRLVPLSLESPQSPRHEEANGFAISKLDRFSRSFSFGICEGFPRRKIDC